MEKQGYVYILTNKSNRVLYTGVTSNLQKRIWEHKQKLADGFTAKYNCTKLVYVEGCGDMYTAITREKQIKGGSRAKKLDMIRKQNPDWIDLSYKIA